MGLPARLAISVRILCNGIEASRSTTHILTLLIVTFSLLCDTPSKYCIEYSNGGLHDVLTFVLIAALSTLVAIAGYLRASAIHQSEQRDNASS